MNSGTSRPPVPPASCDAGPEGIWPTVDPLSIAPRPQGKDEQHERSFSQPTKQSTGTGNTVDTCMCVHTLHTRLKKRCIHCQIAL